MMGDTLSHYRLGTILSKEGNLLEQTFIQIVYSLKIGLTFEGKEN